MEDHTRGSVLVVDDEPTIAEVVARYLERAGYRTRIAADGDQALDARGAPAARSGRARPDAARDRRPRGDAPAARAGPRPDRRDPADGQGRGVRPRDRPAARRRRLRRQAVLAGRAGRAGRRRAAARRRARRGGRPLEVGEIWIDPRRRQVYVARRGGACSPSASSTCCCSWPATRPGVLTQPADGRRLAVLVLHRHLDRHRPHPPAAREDRARSRASRATSRPCGASATGSRRERPPAAAASGRGARAAASASRPGRSRASSRWRRDRRRAGRSSRWSCVGC